MKTDARMDRVHGMRPCRLSARVLMRPADPDAMALPSRRQLQIGVGRRAVEIHQFDRPLSDPLDAHVRLDEAMSAWGLDASEQLTLLRGLARTIAPMLRLTRDAEFIKLLLGYISDQDVAEAGLHVETIAATDAAIVVAPSRARLSKGDLILSFADGLSIGEVERTSPFLASVRERDRLALVSFLAPPSDGEAVILGGRGLLKARLTVKSHPDARQFFDAHATANPDFAPFLTLLDHEAAPDLRRLGRRAPARPVLHEPLLGLTIDIDLAAALPHGVFIAGWFADAGQILGDVTVVDHAIDDADLGERWRVFPARLNVDGKSHQVNRFAAFLSRQADASPVASLQLRVDLKNGEHHLLRAVAVPSDLVAARGRILDTIVGSGFDQDMLEAVYLPALQPIQDAINGRQSVRLARDFGVASSRRVSIVIPLYRETGFIRSQLMAFARDPFVRRQVELVFVVDDPTIAAETTALIEGAAYAFELDMRVVTLERNGGYALANNFGVSEASGDYLVLMNSDVIPENPGWLEPALARLDQLPAHSVIGPKLLYADGSLQHAGMYFEQLANQAWQNFHYWKGYARNFAPAMIERVTPAVTGACMILRKSDFLDVGGFTSDYVVGDYEDSDLCLKLRDLGGVPLYMPSIELRHFERQSMPDDADNLDRGSTRYNRALHKLKWNAAIEQIVAEKAADVL